MRGDQVPNRVGGASSGRVSRNQDFRMSHFCFSSRRRHTRLQGDWSSDVCSSDLSYEPHKGEIGGRKNGVLISMGEGEIFTYALGKLDDRGRMFVKANDPVYEGMIIGIPSRDNDLVVNATRTKPLTNFRASGKADAIKITPPIDLSLEYAVEFIEDDELVEITPKSIRVRKRHLSENERKRASRGA